MTLREAISERRKLQNLILGLSCKSASPTLTKYEPQHLAGVRMGIYLYLSTYVHKIKYIYASPEACVGTYSRVCIWGNMHTGEYIKYKRKKLAEAGASAENYLLMLLHRGATCYAGQGAAVPEGD